MTTKSKKSSVQPPKKAASAYNLWMAEERATKKEANQTLSFSEFAALWKEVPESQKQKFQVLATKDKERFDREMTAFKQSPDYPVFLEEKKSKSEKKGKKRRNPPKDPNAPKKLSGFLVFSGEIRSVVKAKNPSISFAEISKVIATQWKDLPEADKKKFNEKAKTMSMAGNADAAKSGALSSASKKKATKPQESVEEDEEDEEDDVDNNEDVDEEDEDEDDDE